MPEIAGLPATGPTSLSAVKTRLRVKDDDDDDRLQELVDAVNLRVRGWPVAALSLVHGAAPPSWPDDVVLGATMLAARLWRRKDSPAGVETVGELGPVYVQRNDPDIALLLRLGSYGGAGLG